MPLRQWKITILTTNLYTLLHFNTVHGFRGPPGGPLNPSVVLKFSKLYKVIVKIVIFHYWSDTTENEQINYQLLCGHFSFSSYHMTKLVIYLGNFEFSSYPMTKLVILS